MKEGRRVRYSLKTGYLIGTLPVGCRYCLLGRKVVVFITGLCRDRCWYCPISREKLGRDIVFVDENRVLNTYDIVDEVYKVSGLGASITGGDPILVIDRTCNVISLLKKEFGERFHIHLYTSGRFVDEKVLECLEASGLDEIRFHVYSYELLDSVVKALDYGFDVGVEVPFIPLENYIGYLKKLILELDRIGVDFININELEVSETNVDKIIMHGLEPTGLTVKGIHKKAIEFLKWAVENTSKINIHYCTIAFKDQVQYRFRMLNKALNLMGLHEIPTSEGTLLSIERVSGSVDSIDTYTVMDKIVFNPYRAYKYVGSGVKASIVEYYPEKNRVLNRRTIVY